ncbi:unnamed protein product, partial [Ceratitis capitata]
FNLAHCTVVPETACSAETLSANFCLFACPSWVGVLCGTFGDSTLVINDLELRARDTHLNDIYRLRCYCKDKNINKMNFCYFRLHPHCTERSSRRVSETYCLDKIMCSIKESAWTLMQVAS